MKKSIEVVAAIIKDGNKILATQRGYGEFIHMWEFPGGKIEKGESQEAALTREIKEELELDISIDEFLITVKYEYETFNLTMHCFMSHILNGNMSLNAHEQVRWLTINQIDDVNWLPADIEVVEALKAKYN